MDHYSEMKRRLARGWNTWNTRSVLSHVLLPQGLALNLGVKNYAGAHDLWDIQVDQDGKAKPGLHAWDGSYTELTVHVPGNNPLTIRVESAHDGEDLVLLVSPGENTHIRPPSLLCAVGMLWNRTGQLLKSGNTVSATIDGTEICVFATVEGVPEPNAPYLTPYLALPLRGAIGICTGRQRSLEEIDATVSRQRNALKARINAHGELAELYEIIQSCVAWDTIYDCQMDRVITPVSRIWNCNRGGWALFCWDTYFAAALAGVGNKDLAYANAIEITRERVGPEYASGFAFVPNVSQATGRKHRDHSQPPVGAMMVELLHKKYGDRWLLEELFDDLLQWNRWWDACRRDSDLLCWGSNPYKPLVGDRNEATQTNTKVGAMLESGLDNSPMFDDVPFDKSNHLMAQHDVGLNGLYVADCAALSRIAATLHRPEMHELAARRDAYVTSLRKLWNEEAGIFMNRRTDTKEWNYRISPTNFYALFGHAATDRQADQMIRTHLLNEAEFQTPFGLPSTPMNDPAFKDQNYWRGRVWAPLNWLVYLGLRQYDTPTAREARKYLVETSKALLLREWRSHGHVHENYHPLTGEGCDVKNSEPFYHWGALLGLIAFVEAAVFEPE